MSREAEGLAYGALLGLAGEGTVTRAQGIATMRLPAHNRSRPYLIEGLTLVRLNKGGTARTSRPYRVRGFVIGDETWQTSEKGY